MTREERDRMYALCMLIQNEKDPKKFNCLVEELDRLLNTKRGASRLQKGSLRAV